MLQQDTVQQLKNALEEAEENSSICIVVNAILELNETLLIDRIETLEKQLYHAEELLESYKH
jgi:hypothetical protein